MKTNINENSLLKKTKKPKLLVTFDDAYLDFYENALPILQKYKIPAVQHVITQCAESGESFWTQKLNKIIETYYFKKKKLIFEPLNINTILKNIAETEKTAIKIYLFLLNKPEKFEFLTKLHNNLQEDVEFTPMMNWNQIRDATNYDVVIGSHTHSHNNLSSLSVEKARYELKHSLQIIENNISNLFEKFLAYPNGQYNEQIERIAKDCGYNRAFSTRETSINFACETFTLPRFSLYHTSWLKNLIKLKILAYFK